MRFCLIFLDVSWLKRMRRTTSRGSFRTRTMSADSIATSVPAPIAIPTSAWTRAGASFTPSPTIATRCPSFCSRSIVAALSPGRTSAKTVSMPSCPAAYAAVARLSPVSIATRIPIVFRSAIASRDSSRIRSARAMIPATWPSAEGDHVGDAELASGKRPRLVEDDRVHVLRDLKALRIPDQEAALGPHRRREDRDRRDREAQGVGASDDEDRDHQGQREETVRLREPEPIEERGDPETDRNEGKGRRGSIRESLDPWLRLLRLAHEVHDLCEGRLSARLRDPV